jgi:hypothetical protein
VTASAVLHARSREYVVHPVGFVEVGQLVVAPSRLDLVELAGPGDLDAPAPSVRVFDVEARAAARAVVEVFDLDFVPIQSDRSRLVRRHTGE